MQMYSFSAMRDATRVSPENTILGTKIGEGTIEPSEPIPDWLKSLRAKAAQFVDLVPAYLEQVLIAQYPPSASIGWHRDAPMFGPVVIGVSLASDAVMCFRTTVITDRSSMHCSNHDLLIQTISRD